MTMFTRFAHAAAVGVAAALVPVSSGSAQDTPENVRQVTPHEGQMFSDMRSPDDQRETVDTLRFEPWQMVDEMFFRNDVVWLMRHGPTDWSVRDTKETASTDCSSQRLLSEQGHIDMENLGIILADNAVLPGEIVVSEWCRNQQTLEAFLKGVDSVVPDYSETTPISTDPGLNLLLALSGAASATPIREIAMAWDGGEQEGPLLLISHYTNIEELVDFRVYEGEILVLDPDRDLRVIGYLRLRSAAPDVGHFNVDERTDAATVTR